MKKNRRMPTLAVAFLSTALIVLGTTSCGDMNYGGNDDKPVVVRPTVSVEETSNGSIELSVENNTCSLDNLDLGATILVKVNPNDGFTLDTLTVNDKDISSTLKFQLVEKIAYKVKATFKAVTPSEEYATLTIEGSSNGKVELINSIDTNKIALNTTLNFKVTPETGYELKTLKINNEDITKSLSYVVKEAKKYIVNASFTKIPSEDKAAIINFESVKKSEGTGITELSPSELITTNVNVLSIQASSVFGSDLGGIRFSSSKKGGSLTLTLDKNYTFSKVEVRAVLYGTDTTTISLSLGNATESYSFEENKAIAFDKVTSNTIQISSNAKNRFILKEIKFYATSSGGTTDPDEKEPATVTVNKTGKGTVSLDKTEGFSGDVVKATLTPESNWFVSDVKHNGNSLTSSSNDIYTFTLYKGVNTLDVTFKEKVITDGNYDYLYNNTIQPSRGSLGSVDSYYESCRGLKGEALKKELGKIINNGFKQFSYDDLKKSFKDTEVDPEDKSKLVLAYSGERYPVSQFNGWTYVNREHTWPNSRGVGKSGPGADKHMQRICEQKINSSRGNLDFGEVDRATGQAFTGINAGNYKGNGYFEPKDEFKGDTARIIFYMATMYSSLELERPDNTSLYNYWSASYYHGDFEALYKWATTDIDPVSDFEVNRNNVVDSMYQHNRNPFVDHPEFVIMIYDKTYSGPGALED